MKYFVYNNYITIRLNFKTSFNKQYDFKINELLISKFNTAIPIVKPCVYICMNGWKLSLIIIFLNGFTFQIDM